MPTRSARGTRSAIVVALALAAAVGASLPWTTADVAKARNGYGGGYKRCGHGCQVARCRQSCTQARRTCIYCAKQDAREAFTRCAADVTTAADRRGCKRTMKGQVRSAAAACGGLTGQCGGCCRKDYGGDCNSAFADTAGFPGYFKTIHRYGKTTRITPDCTTGGENTGGGGGGASCLADCDREAALAARQCGRKGGGDCAAVVEARRLACRASRCGETPGTTTTTTLLTTPTVTTTTLPGTGDPCAALDCDQFDNFCYDYSCQATTGAAFCVSSPKQPLPCDDGDPCNGTEYFDCVTGCHPGTPLDCEASNDLCYHYTCATSGGFAYCAQQPLDHAACDDGNACNGYESFDCKNGCQPGAGDPCAVYNDFCVRSECTSVSNSPSCSYQQLPQPTCDDGDFCNGLESFDCANGVCVSGAPVFCPPGRHCVNDVSSGFVCAPD